MAMPRMRCKLHARIQARAHTHTHLFPCGPVIFMFSVHARRCTQSHATTQVEHLVLLLNLVRA